MVPKHQAVGILKPFEASKFCSCPKGTKGCPSPTSQTPIPPGEFNWRNQPPENVVPKCGFLKIGVPQRIPKTLRFPILGSPNQIFFGWFGGSPISRNIQWSMLQEKCCCLVMVWSDFAQILMSTYTGPKQVARLTDVFSYHISVWKWGSATPAMDRPFEAAYMKFWYWKLVMNSCEFHWNFKKICPVQAMVLLHNASPLSSLHRSWRWAIMCTLSRMDNTWNRPWLKHC